MISAALVLLAALQLVLAAIALRAGPAGLLTALLGCALAYDSAVVSVGVLLGEGPALETLSVGRFVAHAVGTPLVLPCAILALRGGRASLAGGWVIVVSLIGLGCATTLSGLHLRSRTWADTLRYADAEPGAFPVAAVLAIVILLAIGVAAWIRLRTPWIALGALAVLACSAGAFAAPPLGNVGEALMLAGLVVELRRRRSVRPAAAEH
ncbi:hypothetical protein ACFYYB_27510 [Streptomyces sp. NPDC002886]|uniref:hypothetical protein n=1 Tax=Streptomyces sp. NPDC002886 TaxID=3364667 RepID=UPI0036957BA5